MQKVLKTKCMYPLAYIDKPTKRQIVPLLVNKGGKELSYYTASIKAQTKVRLTITSREITTLISTRIHLYMYLADKGICLQ